MTDVTTLLLAAPDETTIIRGEGVTTILAGAAETIILATGEIGPPGAPGLPGTGGRLAELDDVDLTSDFHDGSGIFWSEFRGKWIPVFFDLGGSAATAEANSVARIEARLDQSFEQPTPATDWIVTHNLGRTPAGVRTFDSGGTEVFGTITEVDVDTVTVSFDTAFAGRTVVV